MGEAGAAPTGDFNTFSLGTALSGAAAGDFSAAAGYPCGLGQCSGLSLRQGFLGLRYLGKGILNLGIHGGLGLRSGSGFLFLQLRRKACSFLFGSYTGGLLFCGNARGFGSLLLRLDSCGFLLGSYSRRLLFGSNTGSFLLGSRLFRSNPVRLRLFRCASGGFLLLLSQLGLQLRSEKTRLDNLHAFRGGRNKLYLGCGRRGCRYQTASQFGRFRRRRGSCLIGHLDKMAGKLE